MYKDMTIIHGILECPLLNLGSKSEGRRAILTDAVSYTHLTLPTNSRV